MANWFEKLFGFSERSYDETRKNLEVVGTTLRSRVNQRSYEIGELRTPSLRELRDEAASVVDDLRGRLRISNISGDVRSLHRRSAHRHALFQVASQFNLLEMVGPDVSPEDGVTRYVNDRTQGPAARSPRCGYLYRNYFCRLPARTANAGPSIDASGSRRGAATIHTVCGRCVTVTRCARKRNGVDRAEVGALDSHGIDTLRDAIRSGSTVAFRSPMSRVLTSCRRRSAQPCR